jgi:hypothetical protein
VTASGSNGEEELIKEAERVFARTRRLELGLVILASLAALVALGVSLWLSHLVVDCTNPGGRCYNKTRDANIAFRNELKDLIRDVGQCQTLQILQHRDANEKAHALNADRHGYAYTAPEGEVPPPIPEQLKEACAQFLPPRQGGTR